MGGVSCGSCGVQLSPTAKFCGECGVRLAQPQWAEYKQVTVLFADVVRSMGLAAELDMERLREVMTELLERSAAVVRRYGGGTVEYTGDGVMALFGAPVAVEDHAFRACLAALAMQEEATRLAEEVQRSDGVGLRLRVGLNSGRVIAGEVGAASTRYAATGETVGFARRMESVAPPDGVMLSEATARLVEHGVVLGEPEWLHVKGADDPVRGYSLQAICPRDREVGRTEASLVGRRWEMAALDAMLERATSWNGGVVNVVASPGIGKSRLARECAALAGGLGMDVFWGFCESHARDVPFQAVTNLLRASHAVADLDRGAARARVREQMPDTDPQDLLLLDDLLGIADPNIVLPETDPDVRLRRLTALLSTEALGRSTPALFLVEDAHWIDAASEAMIADFLAVIPRTSAMVLITSRPEYEGALLRVHGAQTIALHPLADSDVTTLSCELLGPDSSVGELAMVIAERAAGNPFFAEEMVRELVQRGVLVGERGRYACRAEVAEVSVPATVEAAIAARIDASSPSARRTLSAASVIGARFESDLLEALGIDSGVDELLGAELIDQVRFVPSAEYAFRHPLIRAVAYGSQLRSVRAEWHRRLAAAMQRRAPGSEENAALIAEHLEAAGDLHEAYGWHMRAGAWSTNRDVKAARLSWDRALQIADQAPAADPDHLTMRIAPRRMLCATDWQAREVQQSQARFAELRDLCTAAGYKSSLAIAMTALASEHLYAGRLREAAQVSTEQMALLESSGDLTPAMGLASIAFCNWLGVCDFGRISTWSQTIVDLAAGDPGKGAGYGMGSPLAVALAWRGTSRWCLGRPGWRDDLHRAATMARLSNAETLSGTIAWSYGFAMQNGVLRADDAMLRACEEAVRTARAASSDRAVGLAVYTLAVGLLNQDDEADRDRGLDLMAQARAIWERKQAVFLLPATDMWTAQETARRGDLDAAIGVMRTAMNDQRNGYRFYGIWGTGILVRTLLARGTEADVAEARDAIDWLARLAGDGAPVYEVTLLRLRALLSRADGGDGAFRESWKSYVTLAKSLGYEGHIVWAQGMVDPDV